MSEDNLEHYWNLKKAGHHQKAHQWAHSRFKAYKFLLSGGDFFLHKLIQLPIMNHCSAEQPANDDLAASQIELLHQWIRSFENHRKGKQHGQAISASKKRKHKKPRLSQQIRRQEQFLQDATECWRRSAYGEWKILTKQEQDLVEGIDNGRHERELKKLLEQKKERYKGVGPSVQRN